MSEKAIYIGHSSVSVCGEQARLSADITIDGLTRTMYFGVDSSFANCLTQNRADPFVAVMINSAMKSREKIVCQDPVSEKLLFGLKSIYIPSLSFFSWDFHEIEIEAQTINTPVRNQKAVGTGMSFGCDSLYTIATHRKDSEYPVSHLCIFNNGVYGDKEGIAFRKHEKMLKSFCEKEGYTALAVDTNIHNLLDEMFLDVYSQRNIACALALQGLFKTYLYSSGHDEEHTWIDPHNAAQYDVITTETFATESLSVLLSGCETTRIGKLKVLCDFPVAYDYLHPCYKAPIWSCNCGRCKKDVRDMTTIWAMGKSELFHKVYHWENYEKNLPMNLAFLIANEDSHLYKEALNFWIESGHTVPEKSYTYAKMLKAAKNNAE